ncbi:hypothetical protein CPC16_001420 [Podila verticillata]|nr:hypothetical protein CPC16_001420 [Podila verticillata]
MMEDYYDLDAILAEDESRWMCRRGFDDPKIFNSRIRKALRADENHMELPLLSPHFYCMLLPYSDLQSFKERLTTNMDIAQLGDLLDPSQLSNKLDETEKKSTMDI